LGTKGGVKEVLEHPWLREFNMDDLRNKRIKPPFKPKVSKHDLKDIRHFDEQFTNEEAVDSVVPKAR